MSDRTLEELCYEIVFGSEQNLDDSDIRRLSVLTPKEISKYAFLYEIGLRM